MKNRGRFSKPKILIMVTLMLVIGCSAGAAGYVYEKNSINAPGASAAAQATAASSSPAATETPGISPAPSITPVPSVSASPTPTVSPKPTASGTPEVTKAPETTKNPVSTSDAGNSSTKITKEQSLEIISTMISEKGSKAKCSYDHVEKRDGKEYHVIRVYEDMSDHIATLGWFFVQTDTGKVFEWDLTDDKLVSVDKIS